MQSTSIKRTLREFFTFVVIAQLRKHAIPAGNYSIGSILKFF